MANVDGGLTMTDGNQNPVPFLSPPHFDNERFCTPEEFANATFEERPENDEDGLMNQDPVLSREEQVSSPECDRSCSKEFSNFTLQDKKEKEPEDEPNPAEQTQEQAPSLPAVNEEEQFFAPEQFSNANSAMDWDALLNRGNSNVPVSLSKWERDSLYVKFDPLIASRNMDHRVSSVFKAPKPPGSLTTQQLPPPQNGSSPRVGGGSCSTNVGNESANESYKTAFQDLSNGMPQIDEENGNSPGSPISSIKEDAENSFHSTTMNSTRTVDGEELNEEEDSVNKNISESPAPSLAIEEAANNSCNTSAMSPGEAVDAELDEDDIANGNISRSQSIGNGDAENSFHSAVVNASSAVDTILDTTIPLEEHSLGEAKTEETNPHAEQLKRIAELKENVNALQEELEAQKRKNMKMLNTQEMHLSESVNGFLKAKDHFDKGKTEKQDMIRERDEALTDLRTMESAFASMLLMYEGIKTCQGHVEKNIEALKERQPYLEYALQRRDKRDESARDHLEYALQQMAQEFDNRVKERESDNVKLKTKLRMCEMKISNLEGEIEQVDRENVKLRGLCDDLLKR